MLIPIVNLKDKIIGYKERDSVLREDIYRCTGLWITNSSGEILLVRRALTKSHSPGCWGPAVSGTVEKGETYRQNIIKEAREELGLEKLTIKPGKKLAQIAPERKYNYFAHWFKASVNKEINEFVIDKKEVAEIKWFTKSELLTEIKKEPTIFLETIKRIAQGEWEP